MRPRGDAESAHDVERAERETEAHDHERKPAAAAERRGARIGPVERFQNADLSVDDVLEIGLGTVADDAMEDPSRVA